MRRIAKPSWRMSSYFFWSSRMSSIIENFLAVDTAPVGLLVVPEALGLAGFLELVDEVLG